MNINWKSVSVNGIEGFVSKSKYQWFEDGEWHKHPSVLISLNAEKYCYAGPSGSFPSENENDGNAFAKVFFSLKRLVRSGVLHFPKLGDDAVSLYYIFWYTKSETEINKVVEILENLGLSVKELDRKA